MSDRQLHLAYVTTGYPYVSHTFIQNEVLALRRLGLEIDTFALRRAPLSECRTAADLDAWETTYALRPPNVAHYLRAHLRAMITRPSRYFETLVQALRMSVGSSADLGRRLAYFVQSVVLWHRCRLARIGHVHAHFANVSSDVALLAATLGAGELTWSYTMHGPTEFYEVRQHRLAEKIRCAQFVICVSDFARSQLMAIVSSDHWEKLHVVHCGVDPDRFAPAPPGCRRRGTTITSVGRLVAEKGQAILIGAVARLRQRGYEIDLTLVGDGPERSSLEALTLELGVTDHVEFAGAVGPDEVRAVLGRADIFCLPSFAEGVPIVLMEAMAMEIPVVACEVMGIPELVEDGVSGRLVRPGSTEDLIRALLELSEDRELRRRLGHAARARVLAQFELGASARLLYDIFTRCAGA